MGPILQTTPMGSAIAAALVVAGAPMFSIGLHSLRLRRRLRRLQPQSLAGEPTGFGLLRGRVALESPMVGPLSGQPCAGYRLEVLGPGNMRVTTLTDLRPFRLVAESVTAHVAGGDGLWELSAIAERAVAPADPLSANLGALLAQSAEATWLRRAGLTLTLVERALLAGDECWVIGSARQAQPYEIASEVEQARTGTDDVSIDVAEPRAAVTRIEADTETEFLRISDTAPTTAAVMVPAWRALGVIVGPLMSLAGLLYLAALADSLRALSRFAP
jgi:hypothetical protein